MKILVGFLKHNFSHRPHFLTNDVFSQLSTVAVYLHITYIYYILVKCISTFYLKIMLDQQGNLRIIVKKIKPLLGIAIEGGINTKHLLPRIINIHVSINY